jgi:hypothetical protein
VKRCLCPGAGFEFLFLLFGQAPALFKVSQNCDST